MYMYMYMYVYIYMCMYIYIYTRSAISWPTTDLRHRSHKVQLYAVDVKDISSSQMDALMVDIPPIPSFFQ